MRVTHVIDVGTNARVRYATDAEMWADLRAVVTQRAGATDSQ